jgi:hypothetical protein
MPDARNIDARVSGKRKIAVNQNNDWSEHARNQGAGNGARPRSDVSARNAPG